MKKNRGKPPLPDCFILYAAVMLYLLFGRSRHGGGLGSTNQLAAYSNLQPFATILRYIHLLSTHPKPYLLFHALANLVGNVVLFIPLGFFLPAVFPRLRAFWRCLLCTVLLIAAVETLQLVFLVGYCDIDDLLLNTLGSGIGYLVFYLLRRKRQKSATS